MIDARYWRLALLGFAALWAVPASALASDTASFQVYSTGAADLSWFGRGAARARVNLCVVSSTGRFRFDISTIAGGAAGPQALPYEIRFRDGVGAEHVASTRGRASISFFGSAAPAEDCAAGPNAQLEINLNERDLLEGVAGSYFDRLQFSVTPS